MVCVESVGSVNRVWVLCPWSRCLFCHGFCVDAGVGDETEKVCNPLDGRESSFPLQVVFPIIKWLLKVKVLLLCRALCRTSNISFRLPGYRSPQHILDPLVSLCTLLWGLVTLSRPC